MAVTKGTTPSTGRSTGRPKLKKMSPEKAAYRDKVKPYDRSAREFVKREAGGKKAASVGKAVQSGNLRAYKRAVKKPTTQKEAQGAVSNLKSAIAEKTAVRKVRKAARRSVRKGMGRATSEGLSITRNEGSKGLRKAVATIGYDRAKKVANKTKGLAGKPRRGPARRSK